jgi:N-acyl-D-aspartate/D-glutamate deacylase
MLDVLIKAGEVVDGSGGPRRRADVGIRDGRVVEIGGIDEKGRRTIDAEGCVVAPGFVDVHTHLDVQGFWDSTLSPSPLHGVTTVIGGNCGFTVAPLSPSEADFLMRMLARVEGMPLIALEQGVPWDWKTTAEYFDRLPPLAVNAGFMVGHSAIRRVVMGEQASERAAKEDELEAMRHLLRDGLSAGALGFSSTWSSTHNDANGVPVPSRWADGEELIALAAECRQFPGTSLEFLPEISRAEFSEHNVDVMTRMSVQAQRPLNWNVLTVTARSLPAALAKLGASDTARQHGAKVVALTMPMTIVARFSFATGFVLDALPGWDEFIALPPEERLRRLHDPAERRRLDDLAQQPGPFRHVARWDDKVIVETFAAENKRYEGRTVGQIAAEQGKEAFDALADIVCADELRTLFTNPPPVETAEDWQARAQIWQDPRAVIGASDAGAHLDFLGTFNYTTTLLQQGVREQQAIPLEQAVRLLTDVPARLYGLRDRGRLAEGALADVVIFDETAVGTGPLAMRTDLPGDAGRLYASATGIKHVLVNGSPIVEGEAFTDARPGTLLRSGRDTVTPSID